MSSTVKVNYSTGVFTRETKAALAICGFLGVTALALGIITLLHEAHLIPPKGIVPLMGTGGGLLLTSISAMIIMGVLQHKAKESVKKQANPAIKAIEASKKNLEEYGIVFSPKVKVNILKLANGELD